MRIHHYHPDTGRYLGSGEADESPLEPSVYLIPAYATDIEPPAEVAGSTRHFVAGGWEYREIPEPEPQRELVWAVEEARTDGVFQVKSAANHVILNRYPDWKQRNLTARAVELLAAGAASGPEWEALSAAWAWISAVRQESDRVEMAILVADTQIDIDAALATATWPA